MDEVKKYVESNIEWNSLPEKIRRALGTIQEWNSFVLKYSLENCIRWADGVVKTAVPEAEYYRLLIEFQGNNLRLYPYHLAAEVIWFTNTTNFIFYHKMIENLLRQEKAYDLLPNFTARDALQLLGIGRNQYIDMTNRCKAKGWMWNKKGINIREELPKRPMELKPESWWSITLSITKNFSETIKELSGSEATLLSKLGAWDEDPEVDTNLSNETADKLKKQNDSGASLPSSSLSSSHETNNNNNNNTNSNIFNPNVNNLNNESSKKGVDPEALIRALYRKSKRCICLTVKDVDLDSALSLYYRGIVRFIVPVDDKDFFIVPPLQGFVMNRSTNDSFEQLLYRIFVSLDGNTTVKELSELLRDDIGKIKNAISVYCRLGFSKKVFKDQIVDIESRMSTTSSTERYSGNESQSNQTVSQQFSQSPPHNSHQQQQLQSHNNQISQQSLQSSTTTTTTSLSQQRKKVGFLVDKNIAALLMMGNLSPELKPHAVTLYEVGKIPSEDMNSFLSELSKGTKSEETEEQKLLREQQQLYTQKALKRQNEGESETDSETDSDEDDNNNGNGSQSGQLGAHQYFDQALNLYNTLTFLHKEGGEVDMIRCESLAALDPDICQRLLEKNYSVLFMMTPTEESIPSIDPLSLPHYGPPASYFSTAWFRLFLYVNAKCGLETLFLPMGYLLTNFPTQFLKRYDFFVITPILGAGEPFKVSKLQLLSVINKVITRTPLFIQPHLQNSSVSTVLLPYSETDLSLLTIEQQNCVKQIQQSLSLHNSLGTLTLRTSKIIDSNNNTIIKVFPEEFKFGVPLNDVLLNQKSTETISKFNLLKQETVKSHINAMKQLSHDLLCFIDFFNDPNSNNNGIDNSDYLSFSSSSSWSYVEVESDKNKSISNTTINTTASVLTTTTTGKNTQSRVIDFENENSKILVNENETTVSPLVVHIEDYIKPPNSQNLPESVIQTHTSINTTLGASVLTTTTSKPIVTQKLYSHIKLKAQNSTKSPFPSLPLFFNGEQLQKLSDPFDSIVGQQ